MAFSEESASLAGQERARSEVRQLLDALRDLRGHALARQTRFFRSLEAISFSRAAQPAELKNLGYSIVEVLAPRDSVRGPEIRAQFADGAQAVEVVFSAQILLDAWLQQQKEQSVDRTQTHRFLVGQDGQVLERSAQTWQMTPVQGCEVISAAVRYLLSGNGDPKTVLARSCDGGRALATLHRLGVLPYAWVLAERVHQPEEQNVPSEVRQSNRGLWVPAVSIFVASLLILVWVIWRKQNDKLLARGNPVPVEAALTFFSETRQSIGREEQFTRSTQANLQRSSQLLSSLGQLGILLRDRENTPVQKRRQLLEVLELRLRELGIRVEGVLFFDYNGPTRELDWSQARGDWGLSETALSSGFQLSPEEERAICAARQRGDLPKLNPEVALLTWWLDETRGQAPLALARLHAWFFWPLSPVHPTAYPIGLFVVRTPSQVVFSVRQEKEVLLFLRELENLWTTGESSPHYQEPARLDQREVPKE